MYLNYFRLVVLLVSCHNYNNNVVVTQNLCLCYTHKFVYEFYRNFSYSWYVSTYAYVCISIYVCTYVCVWQYKNQEIVLEGLTVYIHTYFVRCPWANFFWLWKPCRKLHFNWSRIVERREGLHLNNKQYAFHNKSFIRTRRFICFTDFALSEATLHFSNISL